MMLLPTREKLLFAATIVIAFAAPIAHADQFVVVDATYTHSAATTTDSHYRVAPTAQTPKDWTKPVDYANGIAHVVLEVKTKPSDAATRFQICFEGTPTYACTDQSPPYTAPKTYAWETPIANFYQGDDKKINWADGVNTVALILKDTMNNKPQGDPDYVPTDLHVVVTIVSAGDTYQPPAATSDAGVLDAGARDAGARDAARAPDAGGDHFVIDAGARDAAVTRRDASVDAAPMHSGDGDEDAGSAPTKKADGCALGATDASWLLTSLLALAARRRRKRA
jgi:hypothetical protein